MLNQQIIDFTFEYLKKKTTVYDSYQILCNHLVSLEDSTPPPSEEEFLKILSEYVYQSISGLHGRTISSNIKMFNDLHEGRLNERVIRYLYNHYIGNVLPGKKFKELTQDRVNNTKRFDFAPVENETGLVVQSNIDEERSKLSTRFHKSKLNRFSKELVKYKQFEDLFNELHSALTELKYNYSTPLVSDIKYDSSLKEASLITIWSDHHFGETVRKSAVNGINEYNLNIAYSRFKELVEKTVQKYLDYSKMYNIDKLYIDILGDMFSGEIHEDLAMTNEKRIISIVVSASLIMSQGIHELLKYVPYIEVSGSYGNHSRLTEKKPFKDHNNNYDYMLLQTVSAFFPREINQGRIKFNIETSELHMHTRRNNTFLLEHGDSLRSSKRIQEILEKRIMTLVHAGHPQIDYVEVGHFHTETELSSAGIYINGSLKGSDEYVFIGLKHYSKPSQKLMVLTDSGIEEVVNLYLSTNPTSKYDFNFEQNPVIGEMFSSYL